MEQRVGDGLSKEHVELILSKVRGYGNDEWPFVLKFFLDI